MRNDLLAEVRAENLAKAHAARRGEAMGENLNEQLQVAISRLEAPRAAAIQQRASQIPVTQLRAYVQAVKGRSPTAGIKAFCSECVGWDRAEVRRCTSLACPLWAYRPFQKTKGGNPDA